MPRLSHKYTNLEGLSAEKDAIAVRAPFVSRSHSELLNELTLYFLPA
jgi:hypothetical protein